MARRTSLPRARPTAGTTGPVRTCVGCRQRTTATALLRVVAVEGVLTPDPRHRLPGRGAHLHTDPECLSVALRRRAFERALRVSGPLSAAGLTEHVAGQHEAYESSLRISPESADQSVRSRQPAPRTSEAGRPHERTMKSQR